MCVLVSFSVNGPSDLDLKNPPFVYLVDNRVGDNKYHDLSAVLVVRICCRSVSDFSPILLVGTSRYNL